MFAFLSNFLREKGIDCFAPVPLSSCKLQKPYLLERCDIRKGTVIMLAIPYYTAACDSAERNISAYAVSLDYHLFFQSLFEELLPLMRKTYPQFRFAGFADHSPIAETHAAAIAGLGAIGKNHMLLTEKYSSYIFLGEIITDAQIPCKAQEVAFCEGCGLCERHCPMNEIGTCLSALTQKKGVLTDGEAETIIRYQSAWGCDICQEVCPHTKRARERGTLYSPIPFFAEQPMPHLTSAAVEEMREQDFLSRAFSWRGKETILRNLRLTEDKRKEDLTC